MSIRIKLIGIGITLALASVFLISAPNNASLAAKAWAGHYTGGGKALSTLPPLAEGFQFPPGFSEDQLVDPGAGISFKAQGRVDSLIDRGPEHAAGTFESEEGATIQGRATWVDHSTDPPRTITLNDPRRYVCGPDPEFRASSFTGPGIDSTFGPVKVNFRTFDRTSSGKPDRVHIFVWERGAGPTPGIYAGFAEVTAGQVVQHACQK